MLTGGPGAGKTAVLDLAQLLFCEHVMVLPESAGIVFGGGFPRDSSMATREAAQRAIFHVQRQLEGRADALGTAAVVLCDRGTLDGAAYWPGSTETFWPGIGVERAEELRRYDSVIHLHTPEGDGGYQPTTLRIETAEQAAVIDAKIVRAWEGHPRRAFVSTTSDFLEKVTRALALLRLEVPECCRKCATPIAALDARGPA